PFSCQEYFCTFFHFAPFLFPLYALFSLSFRPASSSPPYLFHELLCALTSHSRTACGYFSVRPHCGGRSSRPCFFPLPPLRIAQNLARRYFLVTRFPLLLSLLCFLISPLVPVYPVFCATLFVLLGGTACRRAK